MAESLSVISFNSGINFGDTLLARLRGMLDDVIGLTDYLPVGYFKLLQYMVKYKDVLEAIEPDVAKLFHALQSRPAEKSG
jgi:hypothetical protein